MSTTISRLYSWATDKTNGVKITAARVDAEMDQVITALNRKVLCAASAPSNPINGQTWVDTTNNLVKAYLNNAWVIIANYIYIQSDTPTGMSEGYLWYDTANNLLKAYDGSSWVALGNMSFPASTAQGDLLYLSAASTLARLAKDTNASRVLANTGSDNNPAWAQVNTAMLKTSLGEVTISVNSDTITLPGGTYGFYPQIKATGACRFSICGVAADASPGSTYVTNIGCNLAGGVTAYAQQRYVTASGQDFWLFLLEDKVTKKIISSYSAPDHPAYGNGGDFNKLPHPFSGYDPEKHNIYLVDQDSIKKVKAEVTDDRSFLTIVNEDYKAGDEDLVYKPLHSGKYLKEVKNGKQIQVAEMVNSIPDYIKVRKLVKVNG